MFTPKTQKISDIAESNSKVLAELNTLLNGKVFMYIDYANVRPWSDKLKWHIDLKRLKQFVDSFDNIQETKFYHGELVGDAMSEKEIQTIKSLKYILRTKPVKTMSFSIDANSIANLEDRALLKQFIRQSLLRKYNSETIEYLNRRFDDMNQLGEYQIEDRKCNFDVEIGVDMRLDSEKKDVDTCILWSGDSDFFDPIQKLLQDGKKVILFATARKVSKELSKLRQVGLIIFDIKKIKDFICWNREITDKAKEPSCENSKH